MQSVEKDIISVRVVEDRSLGEVRRTIEFQGPADATSKAVSYIFRGKVLPEPLGRCDFAAMALVPYAMRSGLDLHVGGPVSRVLLANLEEFQQAWAKWRPDQYRRVRITAAEVVEPTSIPGSLAVLAYSGGIDGNFSLLRHASGLAGPQGKSLIAAMLIHGFDFTLAQRNEFAASAQRAEAVLDRFRIPLSLVETDWRVVTLANWEMEFAVGIATCLAQFAGPASVGLMGSCEDYSSLVLPWGSNPVTNPLLSSGDFALQTDGTGYTRCEKAELIGHDPHVKDSLRVCWQDAQADGSNCCRCEKCIRTKLNFLANRIEPGASLAASHSLLDVALIKARNPAQISFIYDILRTAERHGVRDPWVAALRVGLALSWLRVGARRVGQPVKKMVRRLVKVKRNPAAHST